MRVLVAPTAFKGSFSPSEVAGAIEAGLRNYAQASGEDIEIDILPLADGGDGSIEALSLAVSGKVNELAVSGFAGEARTALWFELENLAVVELASACGIGKAAGSSLSPMTAGTRGLGAVIKQVLARKNIRNLIVAVGGSASTDGGAGALYEMGVSFLDEKGKNVLPSGGGSLEEIMNCDLRPAVDLLSGIQMSVAADVDNPLLGENGAAHVFGPQKGATPEQVVALDAALAHYADLIEQSAGRKLRDMKGAGAAGGTAFGLAALGARIVSGFEWLAETVALEERVRRSDLVISGEGRIDRSSLKGKVVGSLASICSRRKKPLWLFAGSIDSGLDKAEIPADLVMAAAASGTFAGKEQISQSVAKSMGSYSGRNS